MSFGFRQLYGACWQAWDASRHDALSRRRLQWRTMGDFVWAAFCMQWVVIAWCAVIGKEQS